MLIAFIAVVHLANAILAWVISPMGWSVTIQEVVGWLNVPFAWLMSVPPEECGRVGTVLGERVVFNEFVGYLNLSTMMEGEGALSPRTSAIATYALCGFANFASVAIQIGGSSTLAPERRADLAKLGMRAMVGGLLCRLMVAGLGMLSADWIAGFYNRPIGSAMRSMALAAPFLTQSTQSEATLCKFLCRYEPHAYPDRKPYICKRRQ